MSDTKTNSVFTSKVFPATGDMALWAALDAGEQRAFIESSEQAGHDSALAPEETLSARLARVRASSV